MSETDALKDRPLPASQWRPALALPSPLVVLVAILGIAVLLLAVPLTLPIGPMYWDLAIYFDAANRLFEGQVPSVDFFAPVGPLGYWLFTAGLSLLPDAQPLLLVQWSLFIVTAPAMALVLVAVDRHSRAVAFALLVPFLVFHLLPTNVEQYSSYPSVDGYGIYNRQVCQILYILTAALAFVKGQRTLGFVIFWACLALFLLKITGFVAAGLLCAFAFAAGRVGLSTALAAAAAFLLALGGLEAATGLVSAYVGDILALVVLNEHAILPRFVQAASIHFGIFGSGLLLGLALLLLTRRQILAAFRDLARPSLQRFHALLDRDVAWLGAALFAGLFFETQNTGGQAFIFLWPILLRILLGAGEFAPRGTILVFALVAAMAMPPFVNVLHRSARAIVGQTQYVTPDLPHLKSLGQVSQRQEVIERAVNMREAYIAHPDAYRFIADRRQLPSFTLYSDLDFQTGWLMTLEEGVSAIIAFEAENDIRFDTILALNFANPFPYLLDRSGTRGVAIGADPFRAVPPPSEAVLDAVAATDLVLYPTCPVTNANDVLLQIYSPGLRDHRIVELSPCWRGYLRPGLLPAS